MQLCVRLCGVDCLTECRAKFAAGNRPTDITKITTCRCASDGFADSITEPRTGSGGVLARGNWSECRAICAMAAEAELSASERLVLLVLRFHQAENMSCWPSQSKLAEETGTSERSVRRALVKLEQSGLIQITESIGRVSVYSLTLTPATVSGVGRTELRPQCPATPAKWSTKPRPPCPPNKEGIKKEKRSDAPRSGFDSPRVASEPPPVSADEGAAVAHGFAELLGRKGAKPNGRAHLSAAEQAKCQADPITYWAEQGRLAAAKGEVGR